MIRFISITSELFFILHLEARYSVTPVFLRFKSFLSIPQLIKPIILFCNEILGHNLTFYYKI